MENDLWIQIGFSSLAMLGKTRTFDEQRLPKEQAVSSRQSEERKQEGVFQTKSLARCLSREVHRKSRHLGSRFT